MAEGNVFRTYFTNRLFINGLKSIRIKIKKLFVRWIRNIKRQRLMSRWIYLPVLIQSLKSGILSSASYQSDNSTSWGLASAAIEQLVRCKANIADSGNSIQRLTPESHRLRKRKDGLAVVKRIIDTVDFS